MKSEQLGRPSFPGQSFLYGVFLLSLLGGAAAVYAPGLQSQFVVDDPDQIVNNPIVQSPGNVLTYFTRYAWPIHPGWPPSFYRPLFLLWFRVNYMIFGEAPWGWHLTALLLNLACAGLFGWLVWKLLRNRIAVLLALAAFVLHPAHVECCTYISGAVDALMTVSILAALLFYFSHTAQQERLGDSVSIANRRKKQKTEAAGNPWLLPVLSALFALAALLTKETAIVLPAVILVLEWMRMRHWPALREADPTLRVRWLARQFLIYAVAILVYFGLRLLATGGKLISAVQHLPLRTLVLSWPATLWFYVKVLLWPVKMRAFADPSEQETFSLTGVLWPLLGVLFLLALLALACLWLRAQAKQEPDPRRRASFDAALILGLLLLLLPLVPALNLNGLQPGDYLHGRYAYLPSLGLALLVACAWRVLGAKPWIGLEITVVLAAVFATLTVQQEALWVDDETLLTAAHKLAPNNLPVAQDWGSYKAEELIGLNSNSLCPDNIPQYREIVRIDPKNWTAWGGLGDCYVRAGRLNEAEQAMQHAAELSGQPKLREDWLRLKKLPGKP